MKIRAILVAAIGAVAVPIAVLSACADSISAGFDPPPPGSAFVDPDAGAAPEYEASMCTSYECPAPYETCTDKPGLCNTNVKTDFYNCGACGHPCEFPDGGRSPNASLSCVDGQCRVYCAPQSGDCNGKLDDGCEAQLETDPANCGACGNACKTGEVCWRSACGCPPGLTQCGTTCTRIESDPKNCSACGTVCDIPTGDAGADAGAWPCDAGVLLPHFGPICASSSCAIGCTEGYGDCNSDRCGDGCETKLADDPKNCGACGVACLPGQGCVNGKCECEDPNLQFCDGQCVDVLSNRANCGACGNRCPGYSGIDRQTGSPSCVLGRCDYYCPPGRADCDQRLDNGCEVDVMADPRNCGGCGVECDLDGGQPCVAGSCLTKPCPVEDAGGPF